MRGWSTQIRDWSWAKNKEYLTDELLDTSVAQTKNKEHLTDDFTWHLSGSDPE